MKIVQRLPAAARVIRATHKKPTRAQARKAPTSSKPGTLIVTIVSASIFDGELHHAAPPLSDHLFVVTITPSPRRGRRPRKLEKQAHTMAPLQRRPGRYRIDVAEDPSTGLLQTYPAGASEAVIESGKTTRATVVLANDPLRAVANECEFRIGVQMRGEPGAWGAATLQILHQEFNVAEAGIYWESVQSYPPSESSPLSAPVVEGSTDVAMIQAGLAKNGWSTTPAPPAEPVFNERCWNWMNVGGASGIEMLPTPVAWLNFGQTPTWFMPPWFVGPWMAEQHQHGESPPPPPNPPLHLNWSEILVDHVRATMRFTQRLQLENDVYPWVAPPVYAWVAVNEAFDSTGPTKGHGAPRSWFGRNMHWWSGKSYDKDAEVDQGRAELVRKLLEVAHAVDRRGLLLVNDFAMELFPPAKASAGARQIAREFYNARNFHRMMTHVMKNGGALHGHVGVGYQTHFHVADRYYANMKLYRTALQRGIRLYRGMGLPVVITEMVVRRDDIPNDPTTYAAHKYSKDPTNPEWRKNAAVYRDMIKTYFLEPRCNGARPGVCFWGLYDEPGESDDYYGHLYDAVFVDQNDPGTFSAMNRKPSYFGVLNGLIDAVHQLRGPKHVPNWMRHCPPE